MTKFFVEVRSDSGWHESSCHKSEKVAIRQAFSLAKAYEAVGTRHRVRVTKTVVVWRA